MKKFIPTKRTFFLRFESKIFGDVLNYGLNFQLSSLAQIIYDPLTKFLIKKFSGVESVGLYELVSKLLLQVRQVVVVGVNILVPYIAELYEKNRILDLYFMFFKVFNFVFIITCIVLTLELFSLPFIPHFFAIKGEPFLMEKFKTYYILIAIGIAINLFSVPAYMFNMGIGKVRSNTVASIVGALSYLIFEVVIGFLWKDLGVILGWLMGSVVLSLVVQYQFSIEKKKITWDILNKDSFIVFGLTILTIFIYYCVKSNNYINFSYLIAFLYFSLVLWIVFRNPVVKNLLNKNSRNRS
jgi:O-antigen/teichoic acid export membrane protein